ncbi:MAG: hypothetical protein GY945_05500 [Rhodobacteraceae bacterium]|nr:hypothetical protein [Paracoccaceae bacterium]
MLLALIAMFQIGYYLLGYQAVYQVAYGAITLMAMMIAATFLWLFVVRATPLALGMAYSWAGAGFVLGWWWLFNLNGQPLWLRESPVLFAFLPFYFVGAVLHFAVIHRSFGLHGAAFLLPVIGAVGLSAGIYLLV